MVQLRTKALALTFGVKTTSRGCLLMRLQDWLKMLFERIFFRLTWNSSGLLHKQVVHHNEMARKRKFSQEGYHCPLSLSFSRLACLIRWLWQFPGNPFRLCNDPSQLIMSSLSNLKYILLGCCQLLFHLKYNSLPPPRDTSSLHDRSTSTSSKFTLQPIPTFFSSGRHDGHWNMKL